jgi:hypothetical protein
VQVAFDTWEPTLLVWSQIDGATWTSELGTISTTADVDWFSGVVHGGDLEPVRCWSFARTERALIEKSDLFATRTIAAGDLQCGDVVTVNFDRFTSRKTVCTIEYKSAFGDDLIAVTFTDGLERLYKQSTSVDVHNWPVEAERTLTETPEPEAEPEAEPVITASVSFTLEEGIRLCSILCDSIGHAKDGLRDATRDSEVTWWNERIDIANSAYKAISDAIGAFDAEVAR